MLRIKNLQDFISFYFLLIIFLMTSCTFYKTIEVDPITSESVETIINSKKMVIIHDDKEHDEYILNNINIENDFLKGTITPAPEGKKHKHHINSFRSKSVKAYQPLEIIHIYISTNDLSIGQFEVPLQSIRFVEIHDKDKRKSTSSTIMLATGITITVLGALVRLFIASFGF